MALLLVGCRGDGDDGEGVGPEVVPKLPEAIAGAARIDAWNGRDPNNPADTPLAKDEKVDDQGASSVLAQEMEYVGYMGVSQVDGGYYYNATPAPGAPGRVLVIISKRGQKPMVDVMSRIWKEAARDGSPPGTATGSANGGKYKCHEGSSSRGPEASCMWADDTYLIDIRGDHLDPAAVRRLIEQVRTNTLSG